MLALKRSKDPHRGILRLSTKELEPTPGDMLHNRQLVFEQAERMAAQFKEAKKARAMAKQAKRKAGKGCDSPNESPMAQGPGMSMRIDEQ